MAGGFQRAMVWLGLSETDDDRDYDDRAYDTRGGQRRVGVGDLPHDDGEGVRTLAAARSRTSTSGSLAVAPSSHASYVEEDAGYRITTLHPRTYNEARMIGEQFREGVPVIMNLTEMDDVDAKRLVDFAAGLIFGLRGSIERVTSKVFLLSPANVEVTAEDKARIAEGGFFNQS